MKYYRQIAHVRQSATWTSGQNLVFVMPNPFEETKANESNAFLNSLLMSHFATSCIKSLGIDPAVADSQVTWASTTPHGNGTPPVFRRGFKSMHPDRFMSQSSRMTYFFRMLLQRDSSIKKPNRVNMQRTLCMNKFYGECQHQTAPNCTKLHQTAPSHNAKLVLCSFSFCALTFGSLGCLQAKQPQTPGSHESFTKIRSFGKRTFNRLILHSN